MSTIIPFPKLHTIDGVTCAQQVQPGSVEFPSTDVVVAGQVGLDLPEGESTNAAIDESLKARAMQEDIVRLIRAVRSRFG
jgi:hypothetical protein